MNVSLATLTYYTAPVMVLVLAPFVLGEKQNGRAYLGMAVVALGMLLAVGTDFGEGGVTATGLAVGLGSAVFYAGLMLVNRKISGVSGLNLTFYEIIIAAVILLPYVFGDKRRRTAAQGRTRHFCTALSLHREHGLRLLDLFQSYESAAGQGGGVARLF